MGLEVTLMSKPVEVRALPNYNLWFRYENGAEVTVNVSSLVGRGIFKFWEDQEAFERVHIGPYGEVAWGKLELHPDTLYFNLTGKTPDEAAMLTYSLDWSIMLYVQGALVGNVPRALRGVMVSLTVNVEARIICYFDGPISEDDEEDMQVTYTEVLAAFPDYDIYLETQRLDAPTPLPIPNRGSQRWAYMRSERTS